MISFRGVRGDRTLVGIGLNFDELAQLSANESILVDSAERGIVGGPLVFIIAAATNGDLVTALEQHHNMRIPDSPDAIRHHQGDGS